MSRGDKNSGSFFVGDDNLGVPQVGIKITEVTTRGGTFVSKHGN